MHKGMSWKRLEEEGGIQWPCPDESHPGSPFLHGRLWERPISGPRAPFSCVDHQPPVDELTDDFPIRLTTGRVLDSYNTGVQSGKFDSPIRSGDALEISSEDALRLNIADGETAKVSSRRGSILMRIKIDTELQVGLAFTTFHFPELADVNQLTSDAWDSKSGTSEFKAAAIKIEKIESMANV